MSVHIISLKGKRDQNEDQHDVFINLDGSAKDSSKAPINLYGVYDGHGGKFVSNFLGEHIAKCFTDKRIEYPLSKEMVSKIYSYIQNTLKTKYNRQSFHTGSTCLLAMHFKAGGSEYLNVLNSGDSRCVVCKNNLAVVLTKDHKPKWPEELKRIQDLGGKVEFDGYDWRIKDLSVSRAFGDLDAEPYVTCAPDIYKYKLTSDVKFMVLACDGLWDVMNSQDVVNFVLENCYEIGSNKRINQTLNIAQILGKHAISIGSTDNITIIVVFFK